MEKCFANNLLQFGHLLLHPYNSNAKPKDEKIVINNKEFSIISSFR
jgi:hypothetical protein